MAFAGFALGLFLFLLGMRIMSESLKVVGEQRVRGLMTHLNASPFRGFILGALVTAFLQSSSLTTILVVGLVHGGIISLSSAISVILGANVGTTLTAHLIALNIEELGVFLAPAGFLLYLLRPRWRHPFLALAGFGVLLAGMDLLTGNLAALMDEGFLARVARDSPVKGIMAGALSSALMQSSSAVSAFVIALAKEEGIALAPGLFLVFGADIGTCATSLMASFGTNRGGQRAALAHLLFNIFSAMLILILANPFMTVARATSPHLPRQIANGHTLYNLMGGLLFLPFVRQLAVFIRGVIPDK